MELIVSVPNVLPSVQQYLNTTIDEPYNPDRYGEQRPIYSGWIQIKFHLITTHSLQARGKCIRLPKYINSRSWFFFKKSIQSSKAKYISIHIYHKPYIVDNEHIDLHIY